ncbi:MAG: NAD(P)-binding protein [Steroidobacterales bacterium]
MPHNITRRDFLNGVALAIAGTASARPATAAPAPLIYPPGLTGLRGSHAGSFEVAHSLRDGFKFDPATAAVTEHHDLVIVGGGISGLASAHYYRQHKPGARILILETNDDFGGHAKRNELTVDGKTLIAYGGTESVDSPVHKWSGVARGLLRDIGIDLKRFETAFDARFYERWGLQRATFFKKGAFGEDRLVRRPFGDWNDPDEAPADEASLRSYLDQMPLSAPSRATLFEMIWSDRDVLAGKSTAERRAIVDHISYRDFLVRYWNASEEIVKLLQTRTVDQWAVGIDAVPPGVALTMPGLKAQLAVLGTRFEEEPEPYIYHFPDGNASIARMLVRRMIQGLAPGTTMEDIVTARIDYGRLDRADQTVRIRLNSTAVEVRNADAGVEVAYVKDGKLSRVAARDCVLACYHAMVPYLAPELATDQRAALHQAVRGPLVYANVAVRNWHPWHKLGVHYIDNPGGTFAAKLDFPVSLGGYRYSSGPSEPVCLHLQYIPIAPNQGLSMREQYRLGHARLYAMSFADYEKEMRDELQRMLGPAGFSFDHDVGAITVNRWPHGYAYTPTPLFDEPVTQAGIEALARQKIGRITIANSDAGWDAYTHVAIDQAHRAVQELFA